MNKPKHQTLPASAPRSVDLDDQGPPISVKPGGSVYIDCKGRKLDGPTQVRIGGELYYRYTYKHSDETGSTKFSMKSVTVVQSNSTSGIPVPVKGTEFQVDFGYTKDSRRLRK